VLAVFDGSGWDLWVSLEKSPTRAAGIAQAKRAGKKVGRPARRHQFHQSDIERMKASRAQGASVRKLATDFQMTQWMASKLTAPDVVASAPLGA
jgi:hypothetical protein